MAGCASNRSAVLKVGKSTRQDVFQEVYKAKAATGEAVLKIYFPVKGFKARFVNTFYKHSDPPYTVIVNIDGQSVVLTDEPVLEDLPGDFMKNPEAGSGWKYNFRKELLLEPGKHHVSIAIPLSDVVMEKEMTLNAGVNQLQVTPIYNASVTKYQNYPKFSYGLRQVVMKLNNQ